MNIIQEIKQEHRKSIQKLKSGLIDKNANLNNKIGLIGSDAERLIKIKSILQEFKKDIQFFNNQIN